MKMVKVISIVVVMALLLQILPMQILGAELRTVIANDQVEAMTDTVDASVKIAGEVVEKRTKFAKEYTLTNGLHMAVVYPEAVHYESDGQWLEIDNTLIAVGSKATGVYTNKAGEWSVSFPQQLNQDNRVSIAKNGYSVSFGMAGEVRKEVALTKSSVTQEIDEISVVSAKSTTAQIQTLKTAHLEELQFPETIQDKVRSRLQYSTVYNQTDIIYDVTPSQVKESIVINSFDPLVQGYRYVLELDGLVPILKNDNSIDLVDAETKEVIMQMPAPYMVDASDAVSLDVKVSLERDRDAYVLSYEMPMQWLAEEERQWPVVLDPVVTASVDVNNILDQTVMENYSISYTSGALYAGYRSGWGKMRTYLQYSQLPELSSADVIVSASVSLYVNNATGTGIVAGTNTGTPIEVRGVSGAWNSSTITWNTKPEASDTVQDYAIVTNSGRHFWDITDLARGWYEGTNTGLVFKGVDSVESGSTDEFKKFYSVDYSTYDTGIDPQLCIIFRNNNGLESYWDYTAASAGRAGTGYVNNYTGNLVWTRHDLGFGGNRMPVSINHIYNANDSTNNSSSVGNGWRTNFHQVVYAWNHENAVGEYMAWIDGDGTIHYFEKQTDGTYKDEDGLELTLVRTSTASGNLSCYITDKDGNTSHFNSTGKLIEQRNNQSTTSSITITYDTSGRITKIEDGISRDYVFTYTNGNLTRISYRGTGTTEVSYVTFAYSGSNLTKITDADGKATQFTYTTKNLLSGVTDVDGYNLTYAYDTTVAGKPSRVIRMEEKDGTKTGGLLTFVYGQNQTTITDHNSNKQTLQFNNWGNTISIYDNQGRAQYGQYALDNPLDTTATATTLSTDPTAKGNQLRLSSKMQNTVANMLQNGSFETGSAWTAINTSVTRSISTVAAYMGNKSMAVTRSASGTASGVYTTFTAAAGATYTFSAYVKTGAGSAYLALKVDSSTVTSEVLAANSGWTRLQVSYTNTSSAAKTVTAQFLTAQAGTAYMDCAQIEKAPTASRYNLVENGDFRYSGSPASGWTSSGFSSADVRTTNNADIVAAPGLNTNFIKITGNYATAKTLSQTVTVKGSAKDSYVLSGWAKGNSVPLGAKNGVTREFGLKLIFNHTDGTTDPHYISFNCDLPSNESWQYIATAAVAKKAYSSITVQLVYSRNANTVYFDGIQLFKEQFGTSYAYDANGNIKSVIDLQKQETTYQYQNNNLSKVIQNGKAKMTYEYYDNSNNVKTATTSEGVIYRFNYDQYGNNTSVAITNGSASITSYATYTTDGNRLVSTKDALDNVTKYSYNINTNVLEWVEYPEDTTGTRTQYTYDAIYRLAQEAVAVSPSGNSMSASYTYTDDQLTKLQTASTAYNFTYGDFSLRAGISVGTRTLATYSYTNDRNRYLQRMTYGNGDYVQYAYDSQGRVISETYEDGSVVTYTYDNSGALATVTDSETGITSKYYYDLTDRMMKYAESGGSVEHSVGYTYDSLNNLTTLLETIGTVKHSTTYDYDDDNRVVSVANSVTGGSSSQNSKREYTYDAFGRISRRVTKHNNVQLLTETFAYVGNSAQVASITVTTGNYSVTYSYTYDANGNIATVTNGSNSARYLYDSANQLIREDNKGANATWMWQYNNGGNITSYLTYNYSLASETSIQPTATKSNTYGNSTWGDLLTKSGNNSYSYDTIGNLTSNGQWNFTWKHGRELVSMTNSSGTAWNFRYDANGMRISRTSSAGVTYSYVYNGGQLIQMTRGSTVYQFTYDASGTPMTISQNGTVYYYVTNLQGDVVAILNSSGTAVTQYTYDAWGKLLTATGSQASGVGTYNPLRYRGYIYDQETGLYYLQSRYYDPTLGRFINADAYASTGQGLLGNNMFAYCGNNPVNNVDPTGHAFMQITFDPTGISGMLTPGPWGGGSGGVSPGYTVGSVGPGAKHFLFTYSDSRDVQAGLKTYGYALYKGCLVTVADLPGEGSAFSYGIIVLDAYYKDAPAGEFAETLNHEYGHFIHMAQVGLPAYTATAAIPSFICAGLSHISPWIRNNYYSLPWERTADYLGGVDRGGYLPGADKGAFIYWSCTQAVSIF